MILTNEQIDNLTPTELLTMGMKIEQQQKTFIDFYQMIDQPIKVAIAIENFKAGLKANNAFYLSQDNKIVQRDIEIRKKTTPVLFYEIQKREL